MDFQPLINALPTLLGAIIGAIVSIATTMLSNWHSEKIETRKRADDHKRKMEEQQIDNYEKLQEVVLDCARANVVEYIQIRDLYATGVTHAEVRADEEKSELLRLSQVQFSILCDRVLSDRIRSLAKEFNSASSNMVLFARNSRELEDAFLAYRTATDELIDGIGTELRKLLASEASTTSTTA